MAEDQEDNKKPTLKDRAGFAVWEPKMEMYALEKGDQFGIFHEAGSDLVHNRYLDLPAPQKKVWLQTSKKKVGRDYRGSSKFQSPTFRSAPRERRGLSRSYPYSPEASCWGTAYARRQPSASLSAEQQLD